MGAQPIYTTDSTSMEIVVADDSVVQRRRCSAWLVCTGMRRKLEEKRESDGRATICSLAIIVGCQLEPLRIWIPLSAQ